MLICPSHQIWLIDRCPSCQRRIPSLRSNISRCPSCRQGEYRAAQHISVSGDSILSHSQGLLLHKLGISELHPLDRSSLFASSPLTGLLPWEYVDLLERFSRIAPPLWPERTLALLCRSLGFPEEPFACANGGNRKQAIMASLFYVLFGGKVEHIRTLLPPSPIREFLSREEETPAFYTHLSQLFEAQIRFSLHDRSHRQHWARKARE